MKNSHNGNGPLSWKGFLMEVMGCTEEDYALLRQKTEGQMRELNSALIPLVVEQLESLAEDIEFYHDEDEENEEEIRNDYAALCDGIEMLNCLHAILQRTDYDLETSQQWVAQGAQNCDVKEGKKDGRSDVLNSLKGMVNTISYEIGERLHEKHQKVVDLDDVIAILDDLLTDC